MKETLEKQLQMLSERSMGATTEVLCGLTSAMCEVIRLLRSLSDDDVELPAFGSSVSLTSKDLADLYVGRCARLTHPTELEEMLKSRD